MKSLSAARAAVAAAVKKLEDDAPYLANGGFKEHGRLATQLLDGQVSRQNLKEVRELPKRAAGYAENADKRGADVDGMKREIAMRNVDDRMYRSNSDIRDVWILYRPDLLDTEMTRVTPEQLAQQTDYYRRQADWYREGITVATELVSAVEAQVRAQPLRMTIAETIADAVKR